VSHSFHVDRQLSNGQWVDFWSEETRQTVAFRGACSCGWTGQDVSGDLETGHYDNASMERAYAYWDRHHCPDWERRHEGDPNRE
jgi:hypothetical protein